MRSLQRVSRAGHTPRPDGFEDTASILGGGHASEAAKCGIEGFILQVVRMVIFSPSVGLPEFNHGVRNRRTVAIKDSAGQANALSFGVWAAERAIKIRRQAQVEEWTNSL